MSSGFVLAWIALTSTVGAWVAVVTLAVGRGRRRLVGVRLASLGRSEAADRGHRLRALVGAVGRWPRARLGRSPDPALDRRLGWSLVALAASLLVEPMLSPLAVLVWLVSRWHALRRARRRGERLVDDSPEVVDLLLLAVDAGCNPRLALEAVASRSVGPWGEALTQVVDQIGHGERLSVATQGLVETVGEPARPLVVALLDAEHYGVPLTPSLERLARELAVERRRRAEERARRVPVQLLFPLVFCTLPAFALLTVVPLLAGTLPTLST